MTKEQKKKEIKEGMWKINEKEIEVRLLNVDIYLPPTSRKYKVTQDWNLHA